MTTTLYRAFDDQGQLLYIGISGGEFLRLGQHATNAPWAFYTATITLKRYPTRQLAEDAEAKAILEEDPVWNMRGRPLERSLQWMLAYPDRHADHVSMEEVRQRSGLDAPKAAAAELPEA